jgi:hypothetical protein
MKIGKLMVIGLVFILFDIIFAFLRVIYSLSQTIAFNGLFLVAILGIVFGLLDYFKNKINFVTKYEKIILLVGLILLVIFAIYPLVNLVNIVYLLSILHG